jgi:starvation-inducible DNA-binding protein
MTARELPEDAGRAEVRRLLTAVLADELLLAARTRTYGWNVVGPQFPFLQPFFARQYRQLDALGDRVAERLRALGGVVPPLPEVLPSARLAERPAGQPAARDMVAGLLADHEALLGWLGQDRPACGPDRVTADLLAGLAAVHERLARRLRACLESPAQQG